jgi:hypothetical protein
MFLYIYSNSHSIGMDGAHCASGGGERCVQGSGGET